MNKKVPIRRCVGCRESKPKKELVRVVRDPLGGISVDLTGKKSGRGAYICRCAACLQSARKSKSLARSLECEISDEIYERLAQEMEAAHGE